MKVFKKFGWFVVCMLVAALSLVVQVLAAFVPAFFYALSHSKEGLTQAEWTMQLSEWMFNNMILVILAYQIVALLLFGIWYYVAYGRKKRPAHIGGPGAKQIGIIVGMGVLMQIVVSGILNIIYTVVPGSLDEYVEMIENAGIGEASVIAMLATVIMAPIGEELLCRGIIFRLARHVSAKFWVANTIQAFAFGLIHANLVQGVYAFAFGLVLGYVYGKYERIWVCMLLHGVINFSASGVDIFWAIIPGGTQLIMQIVVSAIALAGIAFCIKKLGSIGGAMLAEKKY